MQRPGALASRFGTRHQCLRRAAPAARRAAAPRPPRASADDDDAAEAMTKTLSALDALLGVDPEQEKKDKEKQDGKDAPPTPPVDVSFSPVVIKALADAEAGRAGKAGGSATPADSDSLSERMARLAEAAKRVASADGNDPAGERELRQEFEKLAALVGAPAGAADKADLQKIKDAVFGPRVFWVTETAPLDPFVADGWLVRGNLRAERGAAFKAVADGVEKLFGDKYVVLLVEDPADDPGDSTTPTEPRVAFQIVTAAAAAPPAAPRWQPLAGAVLALLSAGSSLQLGVAANVFRLPQPILDWLADPAGLAASPDGGVPDFVSDFDPSTIFAAALPIAAAVLAVQAAHEVGHAVAGRARGVESGLPLLVPNGQLGTFGAITQLRSLAADRAALLDFSLAGPAAGGAVAALLFFIGLASSGGDASSLIPVPAALLQGSLLLGGVAKAALAGAAPGAGGAVMVSPLLVAGWAGLVATAFNALPVGRLDGGRAAVAAFGPGALALTSFLTYVGLALGLLGGGLALPFGLYVLVCQRDPESPPRDAVTPPSGARRAAVAAAVGLALLILLPASPDVADVVAGGGMGGGTFL
jgi:hypothetical protein